MKRLVVELLLVTLWALFAWSYHGVEDGSSGFSPIGKVYALFLMPARVGLELLGWAHSNADLPLIFGACWVFWAVVVGGLELLLRRRRAIDAA